MRNQGVSNAGSDRGAEGRASGGSVGAGRKTTNSVSGRMPSARGVARAVPVIGGFVLLMAAMTVFGILADRPSALPWNRTATIVACAVLAVAGVALIAAGFVWPRPLTDDERRAIARAGKPTAEERARTRLKLFAAAGLLVVWGLSFGIGGGVRYGWGSAEFRGWAATGIWALAAAACMIVAGLLSGRNGRALPVPCDDERERLVKLKADSATGRIMYVVCIATEILLFSLSMAFDFAPLMYVALGFLGAAALYGVVAALARRYYDRRL